MSLGCSEGRSRRGLPSSSDMLGGWREDPQGRAAHVAMHRPPQQRAARPGVVQVGACQVASRSNPVTGRGAQPLQAPALPRAPGKRWFAPAGWPRRPHRPTPGKRAIQPRGSCPASSAARSAANTAGRLRLGNVNRLPNVQSVIQQAWSSNAGHGWIHDQMEEERSQRRCPAHSNPRPAAPSGPARPRSICQRRRASSAACSSAGHPLPPGNRPQADRAAAPTHGCPGESRIVCRSQQGGSVTAWQGGDWRHRLANAGTPVRATAKPIVATTTPATNPPLRRKLP